MDTKDIKTYIEAINNDIDIIYNYSICIEHLSELRSGISLPDNPIDIKNKLNKCIVNDIKLLLDNHIEEFKQMIDFHINYRRNNNIDNKNLNKNENKIRFNFTNK